jgi:hypothetical protein
MAALFRDGDLDLPAADQLGEDVARMGVKIGCRKSCPTFPIPTCSNVLIWSDPFAIPGFHERFPIAWNHVIEKESLKFKELEQGGIEKVEQLFGTCSCDREAFESHSDRRRCRPEGRRQAKVRSRKARWNDGRRVPGRRQRGFSFGPRSALHRPMKLLLRVLGHAKEGTPPPAERVAAKTPFSILFADRFFAP